MTQDNIRDDDIYWRGSIGQKHSATTSLQRWRHYHMRYITTVSRAPHRPISGAQL